MELVDLFKDIAIKVPRCSGNTAKMLDYLVCFAKENALAYKTDRAGNIVISSEKPKICLQAHYDMVCLGDGSPVEIVDDGVYLRAKNSTLGADNGIGVAMILALFLAGEQIEALLINDEEIGLLGARGLELEIESKYILNLDAEEEGFVYVGCAGGFEIEATKVSSVAPFENIKTHEVLNLPGGHSGIDIDKNIPNAIIENLKYIKSQNGSIVSFDGGEKLNSIPKSASSKYAPDGNDGLVDFLLSLPHGVLEANIDLGIPQSSINFAKLNIDEKKIKIQMYARFMSQMDMRQTERELVALFEADSFEVHTAGHYAPWEADVNEFSQFVRNTIKRHFYTSGFKAIHAGLECGILQEKMPEKLFASIGPNIHSPHTLDERVEIASVEKVFEALKDVVRSVE